MTEVTKGYPECIYQFVWVISMRLQWMSKAKKKQPKKPTLIIQRDYEQLFKILVIGDAGVGKTSLISKYVNNQFSETYVSTIGIDFREKISVFKKTTVKLQIWDTAGQERFHTITKAYYRGAQGLIIAFDITNPTSFHHLQYWLQHISQNCQDRAVKIIVATKSDLTEQRKIQMEQVRALCEETGCRLFEVSSKTGKGVQEVFDALGHMIMQQYQQRRESKAERMSLSSNGYEISFKSKKKCDC